MNNLKMIMTISTLAMGLNVAQASYNPEDLRLECSYQYDSQSSYRDDEVTKEFVAKKEVITPKEILFTKKVKNIEGYSIRTKNVVADWTRDAEIYFEAILKGNILEYGYVVYNIVVDKDVIQKEYMEKRSIDLTNDFKYEDSFISFDIDDRDSTLLDTWSVLMDSTYDFKHRRPGPYAIKMDDCHLFVKAEEEVKTPLSKKEQRRLRRDRRRARKN